MELFNNHINNGGNLDYSEKEYGYLNDELDDIAIGYFKEAPDGDYQEKLVEEGFTLNNQEAYDILEHRLKSINEELEEFKTGGKTGDVVEYETKRIINKNKREPFLKDTHFAIHKPTKSIVTSWDYKGYDKEELQSEKDSYFFQDIRDNVEGNVDKFVKSDFKIIERKNLQKDGINLNDYVAFVGQKYKTGGKTKSKEYSVWNWTDDISATNQSFSSKQAANDFIKQFRDRYKQQGYYRDNRWRKIAPEDIELEIYEINE